MPAREQAIRESETRTNNMGSRTDVPVVQLQKVRYTFKITSSSNVRLPYAVAVNGKVMPAFANATRRVSGSGGHIDVQAARGSRVSLYLNSDAHPSYRQQAVYAVTVDARDVEVLITEKAGRHTDSDTPTRKADDAAKGPPTVDRYTAPLTGDIWMKISHRYRAEEVDALMPAGTAKEVVAAIKSIYAPLKSAKLAIAVPADGVHPGKTLNVTFLDSDNPRQNISRYSLLEDGLTRVHPAGYAALFNAALENGIPSMRLTSCWRPMLGSIAHRAGLGLDVDYLGEVRLNRQELKQAKGDGDDKDNVTDEEIKRYRALMAARSEQQQAQAKLAEMQAAERQALAVHRKDSDDPKARLSETHPAAVARKAAEAEAVLKVREARRSQSLWEEARNAGQPISVARFRSSLLQCQCVAQLFDPWVMDANTHDGSGAAANLQLDANEKLHSHHLHVTVHEPSIL